MATNLRLADVKLGTPPVPTRWSNEEQRYCPLDPRETFVEMLHDRREDCRAGEIRQSLFLRHISILDDADMYHRNFFEYLEKCWGSHLGIVVTPDVLWFTALNELVALVKEMPDTYRHLFTDSHEKRLIVVDTAAPEVMPLPELVQALRNHVPTEATLFLPDFTTTTSAVRHSMYASFCDMCSPYYNYGMFSCAFPFIQVQGERDDWARLFSQWEQLKPLFSAADRWMERVGRIFRGCLENLESADWWRKMFHLERCGSGHQTEVSGWLSEMYRVPPGPAYVSNFPTNVAKVEYRQLNRGRDFVMQDGLFCSRQEGDFMVPEFGYTVHEKLEVEPEKYDPHGAFDAQNEALGRFLERTRAL
jgi:hypothetical protein